MLASPYGLDPATQFKSAYGVANAATVGDALLSHVKEACGLRGAVLERLHLGHGLALTRRSNGRRYVFKLSPDGDAATLAVLFERLDAYRSLGMPLPHVHRTRDGFWSQAPLSTVAHQGYLMDLVPGSPAVAWSDEHARGTASFLAHLHRLGLEHRPQPGDPGLLDGDIEGDRAYAQRLVGARLVPEPLGLGVAERVAMGAQDPRLVRTHIHGDARLCHFLFSGVAITGVIDLDQGCWGHRLRDVAFHAISHPDPAQAGFLSVDQIMAWLAHYDRHHPLNEAERQVLPAALAFALLVELSESVANHETGRSEVTEADVLRAVASCSSSWTGLGATRGSEPLVRTSVLADEQRAVVAPLIEQVRPRGGIAQQESTTRS